MATKTPVSKVTARKPAPAKATAKPSPAKPATPAAAEPAGQPVWPVESARSVTKPTAAATPVAPALSKEETKMEATIKNAAEQVAAKGQAAVADMNTRAKAAMEKSTQAFAELNEFNKGNVEALVESGKIAAAGLQSMGQDYADYARRQFEGMTATMKSFAGIKSPTEFLQLHANFVRGQFDSMVAETSKNTEAMLKLAGDVAKPISNRVAVAAEKLKVAA